MPIAHFKSRLLGFCIVSSLLMPAAPLLSAPVNINTADAATIARELKGIGLKRAQSIVDYRAKNGPFKSADELRLVKGIGAKVIQNNRAEIRVEAAKTATSAAPRKP
ncbi:MAG: ComEA family DNA-binding protein [Pseudomonadota bacterium]